jgi:hypothetical protein
VKSLVCGNVQYSMAAAPRASTSGGGGWQKLGGLPYSVPPCGPYGPYRSNKHGRVNGWLCTCNRLYSDEFGFSLRVDHLTAFLTAFIYPHPLGRTSKGSLSSLDDRQYAQRPKRLRKSPIHGSPYLIIKGRCLCQTLSGLRGGSFWLSVLFHRYAGLLRTRPTHDLIGLSQALNRLVCMKCKINAFTSVSHCTGLEHSEQLDSRPLLSRNVELCYHTDWTWHPCQIDIRNQAHLS